MKIQETEHAALKQTEQFTAYTFSWHIVIGIHIICLISCFLNGSKLRMDHPSLASDRLHYILSVQTLSGSWIVLTHLEVVGCADGVLWFIHILLWQTELSDHPLISPRLPGLTPEFPLIPPENTTPTVAHCSHTCSSLVKTNGGGDLSHAKECRHSALTCASDVTRHK